MRKSRVVVRWLTAQREALCEAAGFALLIAAAWMVHEVAGLTAAGLALLNCAYASVVGGKR